MDNPELHKLTKKILEILKPEEVLEELGIHWKDVSHYGNKIRCHCPIHHDGILKSLWIDTGSLTYHCETVQCSGARGGDMLDLYTKSKPCTIRESIYYWANRYNLLETLNETVIIPQANQEEKLIDEILDDISKTFSQRLKKQVQWSQKYHYPVSLVLIQFRETLRDSEFNDNLYKFHWIEKVIDILGQFVSTKNQVGYNQQDYFTIMIPLISRQEAEQTAKKMVQRIKESKTYPTNDLHDIFYGVGYYSGDSDIPIDPTTFIQETMEQMIPSAQVTIPSTHDSIPVPNHHLVVI